MVSLDTAFTEKTMDDNGDPDPTGPIAGIEEVPPVHDPGPALVLAPEKRPVHDPGTEV